METIRQLQRLQDMDTAILRKRVFIDNVPKRIFYVDEPLKLAKADLEKTKQKNEALARKKRDREKQIDDVNEKIAKMKGRANDIKTNDAYQAHLKEIETAAREITAIEDDILLLMEELETAVKIQKEKEIIVTAEEQKINAFKKELDAEVEHQEKELAVLKEERNAIVSTIDADAYKLYMTLLETGQGIAVAAARNEICLGCNMNIPPQLFVELRKNDALYQCPQCDRILYYLNDETADRAS